jgi:hypothetical protein
MSSEELTGDHSSCSRFLYFNYTPLRRGPHLSPNKYTEKGLFLWETKKTTLPTMACVGAP